MIAKIIPIETVKKQLACCEACPYVEFVEDHLKHQDIILVKLIKAQKEECHENAIDSSRDHVVKRYRIRTRSLGQRILPQ